MSEDIQSTLRSVLVEHYESLKRRLARRVGDELAGDALQDTWLRLRAQREGDRQAIQSPKAYLMRMAVNLAVDIQRSRARIVPADEVEALIMEDLPDPAPGPAQVFEDRAAMQALFRAMQRMPHKRREILILVRWEGLSYREVAQRTGLSERTVEYELKAAHDYCVARTGRDLSTK